MLAPSTRGTSRTTRGLRPSMLAPDRSTVVASTAAAEVAPIIDDASVHRRMRSAGDLYGRSLAGPIFYAIGSLVTAGVADHLAPLRLLGWLPAVCFVAMFVLRRRNRPPTDFVDPAPYARWRRRHWILIHAGCLLWGAVSVHYGSLLERGSLLPLTVSVIITCALGTALSQAFAMERRQTTLTVAFLYVPSVILFTLVPPLRPIALTLSIYAVYLLSSLRRAAQEYDAQITTELALLASRAEVERMTRVDALTGLANRREYDSAFPKAWHQAARSKGDMALIVFDLDHFKALNDGHGHLAGDACLQHFARLLEICFRREVDLLARIGGEEFVAVLPGTTTRDAERMAETVRAELELRPCEWEGKSLPMTVSVGVGSADWVADAAPQATFARVDAACYDAKTAGRNRVVLSSVATSLTTLPATSPG
jgi:diguanylate cyclase (GGDEF)-like protein